MRLPIDTQTTTFLVASDPEAVVDYQTKEQKLDRDGNSLWQVGLVMLGDAGGEVISVKVASQPKGVTRGTQVKVSRLVATPYLVTKEDGSQNHGVSFRAASIEPTASRAA